MIPGDPHSHREQLYFLIAGDELGTKSTFLLLEDLFALQAGDVEGVG